MTQRIRLWKVVDRRAEGGGRPQEIPSSEVGLEKRLEDWLEHDISMLDPGLLVVGRQVHTPNGRIDLLCIDREGLIVVVELKKGRTSREVVAQALDYASWAKDLNADDVEAIAKDCDKIENDRSLQDAFDEKFEVDRGDRVDLCEGHRSIVVAEDIDDSTERIVRYLSELRVPINIARMHVFKDSTGQEMLAQVFLVEPEVARARSSSNRRREPNTSEMQALADEYKIGELFQRIKKGVTGVLESPYYYKTKARYPLKTKDNKLSLVLDVDAVSEEPGKMPFVVHATRCSDHLGIPIGELQAILPTNKQDLDVRGWRGSSPEEKESAEGLKGTFSSLDEVSKFVAGLREAKKRLATD